MSVYVAFLRGMNLGRRRIKNDELCAAFRDLGFDRVSAFLASGNVIFASGEQDAARVARTIESGLERALDYAVPTYVRRAGEVAAIARREPFTAAELEGAGKPQVMLFAGEPGGDARERLTALSTPDDRLVLDERELYWLPRGSILDTVLDLKAIERELGGTTMRTKRTLDRLAAKLDA